MVCQGGCHRVTWLGPGWCWGACLQQLPKFLGWEGFAAVPAYAMLWGGLMGETWEPGFPLSFFLLAALMLIPSQLPAHAWSSHLQNQSRSRATNGGEGKEGER